MVRCRWRSRQQRKRSSATVAQVPLGKPLLGCGEFAHTLGRQASAMAKLARKVPPRYINLPLHDTAHAK
jgi:hypothetical protein